MNGVTGRMGTNQHLIRSLSAIINEGGIKYAEEQMFQFRDKAISLLNEIPDSPAKSSFQQLIDYSINRDK